MINLNTKLTVFHNDQDYSRESADFTRDPFTFTFLSSDYLYVGFYKPVNSVYIQAQTPNTNVSQLSVEYFDGSGWTQTLGLFDDTNGLLRSGFITWDRNQPSQSKSEVNGETLYWVRISVSDDHSEAVIQAINFVFADDNDLVLEVPEITDVNHLAGKTSHILTHVAVRNQLIQDLNNKDYKKINQETGLKEDLTYWDILDVNQIKQAAVYLALSKIYFNFSDAPEDKFIEKSRDYLAKYREASQMSRLYLDTSDDGLKDTAETQVDSFKSLRIRR